MVHVLFFIVTPIVTHIIRNAVAGFHISTVAFFAKAHILAILKISYKDEIRENASLTLSTDWWIVWIIITVCFLARVSTFITIFVWSTIVDNNALAIRDTLSIFISCEPFIAKTHISANLHAKSRIIWVIS